jgi:hypothetical protein
MCNTPELRALVLQLIVAKVPTEEMLEALLGEVIGNPSEGFGLVSLAVLQVFSE